MTRPFALIAAGLLAVAPTLALAQKGGQAVTYRCTGKDGKRYYGSTIPPQCAGQVIEELNSRGLVVKRHDAAGDEAAKAAKEAELEKRREAAAAMKEESRRNRALLATYTSEKDIDEARRRDLQENQRAVREVEARIAGIRKEQTRLTKELEFYSGKNKPPAKLTEEIKNTEIDLQAQQGLLEAKKKEVVGINAKYDEDKKRYRELTGKKTK